MKLNRKNTTGINLKLESIIPDGYPVLSAQELGLLYTKDEGFFLDNIGCSIYVASKHYNGVVKIIDNSHAHELFSIGQAQGFKFMTLAERAIQAAGTDTFSEEPGTWEPSPAVVYERKAFINGYPVEGDKVKFMGCTPEGGYYAFQSVEDPAKLYSLRAEGYSSYMKHNGNNILFEAYKPLN